MNGSEIRKIFFEGSIWAVLETFESGFDRPIKAKLVAVFTFLISITMIFGIEKYNVSTQSVFNWLENIVDVSLLFASSLFGVSVAAFAIFASSLDRNLTQKLVETNHHGSISVLNFLFSLFAYVMVTLFGVIFTSLLFAVFFWRDSVFMQALDFSDGFERGVLLVFMTLYLSQIAFSVSVLFSFIWNFHTLLLTMAGVKVAE